MIRFQQVLPKVRANKTGINLMIFILIFVENNRFRLIIDFEAILKYKILSSDIFLTKKHLKLIKNYLSYSRRESKNK